MRCWWYLIWHIRKSENVPGKGSQSLEKRYNVAHIPVTMAVLKITAKFSAANNHLLHTFCGSGKFDLYTWELMLAVDFELQFLTMWDISCGLST